MHHAIHLQHRPIAAWGRLTGGEPPSSLVSYGQLGQYDPFTEACAIQSMACTAMTTHATSEPCTHHTRLIPHLIRTLCLVCCMCLHVQIDFTSRLGFEPTHVSIRVPAHARAQGTTRHLEFLDIHTAAST